MAFIGGPTDAVGRCTCEALGVRVGPSVLMILLSVGAACGGPDTADAGASTNLPGDGDGDGDGDRGDGDGDTTGDGDGDGDACAALYDLCESDNDCCGTAACVGSSGPGDPGTCEALDDPSCQNPSTCFSAGDCCSPTTCLGALGEPGICG